MQNSGPEKSWAGIKTAVRNISYLRYVDDTILKAEGKEELKSLLMSVKEESENSGLKLNIPKTKITKSDPNASWKIEVEKCGCSDRFYFLWLQNNCGQQLHPWN